MNKQVVLIKATNYSHKSVIILSIMLSSIGLRVFHKTQYLGEFILFCTEVLWSTCTFKFKKQLVLLQMYRFGVSSIWIVSVTALFVGMAFSVQVVKELLRFGAPDMVGGVIALAIWRELGPLITSVVIAGRVGSAISAEIGSMQVNEEVLALNVMGQDSIQYLVVPRVLALFIMVPLLVGVADIIGVFGGLIIALSTEVINYMSFIHSANMMLSSFDIISGLIKGVLFSLIISFTSTFYGLKVKHGAQDVGRMTRKTVVVSLVSIFIMNYLMSFLFFT